MNEADRKTYIGGTDAVAIAGLSKYKTPYEVWQLKTGRATGDEDNDVMLWGRLLEPLIAEQYILRHGGEVITSNEFIQDQEYPFLAANIDRKLLMPNGDKVILECKTVASRTYSEWKFGLPLDYYGQVQWYLGVTGYQKAVVAILVMDNRKMEVFDVVRDDEFINELRTVSIEFWMNYVLTDSMPDMAMKDFSKIKVIPNDSILADFSDLDLHGEIVTLKTQIKELETQLDEKVKLVKTKLGDKSLMVTPDGRPLFSWNSSVSKRVDLDKLRAEFPDAAQACTVEGISRTLLTK